MFKIYVFRLISYSNSYEQWINYYYLFIYYNDIKYIFLVNWNYKKNIKIYFSLCMTNRLAYNFLFILLLVSISIF